MATRRKVKKKRAENKNGCFWIEAIIKDEKNNKLFEWKGPLNDFFNILKKW